VALRTDSSARTHPKILPFHEPIGLKLELAPEDLIPGGGEAPLPVVVFMFPLFQYAISRISSSVHLCPLTCRLFSTVILDSLFIPDAAFLEILYVGSTACAFSVPLLIHDLPTYISWDLLGISFHPYSQTIVVIC